MRSRHPQHLRAVTRNAIVGAVLVTVLTGCSLLGPERGGSPAPTSTTDASSATPTATPTPSPVPTDQFVDSGPTDFATGDATELPDGALRYIVQPGDVGNVICERFGREYWQGYLADADGNPVNGALGCMIVSFPGDVMILTRDTRAEAIKRARLSAPE
jgi:hypothetical protein